MPPYGLCVSANSSQLTEDSVNLESTSAEVVIRGFVNHLSIKLVYRNVSDSTLEVAYVCPVDAKAALYSFEAKLEGRTITAHCLEKKKAQETYKNAVKQGHIAILGSEDELSGDILHLSLGNLPKGETAELSLKMVKELPVGVDGGVVFTLPTVFNPRYCPADQEPGPHFLPPGSSVAVIPSRTHYSLEVKGEVRGSHKIARVTSDNDPINVQIIDDETTALITQDGGTTLDHDWSFKVYYQTAHRPQVFQMTGDRSGTGLMKDDVLMLNLFPEIPVESFSPHNEIIFVVDRSGSMDGTNIVHAKNTLLLFLKSLPPGCRFNIISFGSEYSSLFESSSERYTEETLNEALRLQKSMQADMGGTEIMAPLKYVYAKDLIPGYARQIIVLTDGAVWNLKQIFDLVSRHAGETRVFAVGIGDGASTALIQGIAESGRGRYEMVIQESQLQMKVMSLVASMLQDNVSDLRVDIEADPSQTMSLVPKLPPVIFGGQHLILYARIAPKTTVKVIKISGKIGDKEFQDEIKEKDCHIVHDSNFSFHRMAAKAQLRQWELEGAEDMHEKMIELSVPSNVVCKSTAIVGIDQDQRTIIQEYKESSSEYHMSCRMAKCSKSNYRGPMRATYSTGKVVSGGSQGCLDFESLPGSTPFAQSLVGYKANDEPVAVKQEEDQFLGIVSSQRFDGSWDLQSCLHSVVVPGNHIEKMQSELSLDDSCFATAMILAFLEVKFATRRPEWQLLHVKGKMFLQSKGIDVAHIIDMIVQNLKSILEEQS